MAIALDRGKTGIQSITIFQPFMILALLSHRFVIPISITSLLSCKAEVVLGKEFR